MKYHFLFSLPLLFSTSFLTGLTPEEKEVKFKSIVGKFQQYSESLEDLYQDRFSIFSEIQNIYKTLKYTDTQELAMQFLKNFFALPKDCNLTEETYLNYLQEGQTTAAENATIPKVFKKKINESSSFSTAEGKASFLFEYLLNFHYDVLNTRLKRVCEGKKILPTAPDEVEKLTNPMEKSGAQISITTYQERISFLVKLFPLIDSAYLSETSRARLALDKNLMDRLEKRTKDMGHPDQGFETNPPESWISILFKTPLAQATDQTKPKELKRLKEELEKRKPTIFYIKTKYIKAGTNLEIRSEASLNFERLEKIPFQNRKIFLNDQLTNTFSSPNTKQRLFNDYENWIQEKKMAEKKEAPVIPNKSTPPKKSKPKEKQHKVSNNTIPLVSSQKEQVMETPSSSLQMLPSTSLKSKEAPLITENSQSTSLKNEQKEEIIILTPKDREKRKEEWERKQKENKTSAPTSEIKIETKNENQKTITSDISEKTLSILYQLYYKDQRQTTLKWKDFVSTWRELRKLIDRVEDEPITKTGGTRKFHGGPLQEGKKKKARSFTIHEPHPSEGHTLGPKAIERIADHFQNKFGWTPEKLGLTEKK
ncbi:hypothetical protein Bealeia1_01679 [Candidatus Bealeia paramacronuclearis]|uniref:Uncharacterized protein n=1 Tax=Candidatus Bealeia paramacronuclearis TaxID=1921001 RepID=A0ABZ2C5Y7_9PROT|nr:hypothetical protein [Candidatus Bealeia paramacronuclearis]